MATSRGTENPLLDGYRFVLDKKSNDTTYWKCAQFRTGCRARISTNDRQLSSPVPDHDHDPQTAKTNVHVAKQKSKTLSLRY